MKFSAQEEYGLRCLLRIARMGGEKGLTIPEISRWEGITQPNVAKLLRIMRIGGFLESSRGQTGGYTLARPVDEILVSDVLTVLGGRLYDKGFCSSHMVSEDLCRNTIDCSIKSLWQTIQSAVDNVLNDLTLKELIAGEEEKLLQIAMPEEQDRLSK